MSEDESRQTPGTTAMEHVAGGVSSLGSIEVTLARASLSGVALDSFLLCFWCKLVDVARAYSNDLREKVLAAYASGKGTWRALSERFEVSYGWVFQRRRLSAIDAGQVRRLVRNKPDIVLRELQEEILTTGQRVSIAHL